MRYVSLLVVCLLVFGVAPATAQNAKKIKSEKEFRALVVDKKLSADKDWMIVKSNGTTEGHIFGEKFSANWVWQNGMYCRNAIMGKRKLGTDCQAVSIAGKSVSFRREYGKGKTGVMQLP